jgi:hypothetical protein
LRKIVRVDDKSEKIHGAVLFHEQVSDLNTRKNEGVRRVGAERNLLY